MIVTIAAADVHTNNMTVTTAAAVSMLILLVITIAVILIVVFGVIYYRYPNMSLITLMINQ